MLIDESGRVRIEDCPSPLRLDLGCGAHTPEGFIGIDKTDLPGVDVVADIGAVGIPFHECTAELVRASDFIEHVEDKIFLMNEIFRVLKPNGLADIFVPSTDGRGAFQDPTHVSFWNENSFSYYTPGVNREMFDYYGINCLFTVEELYTTPMSENQICHVVARLRAVKDSDLGGVDDGTQESSEHVSPCQ